VFFGCFVVDLFVFGCFLVCAILWVGIIWCLFLVGRFAVFLCLLVYWQVWVFGCFKVCRD